MNTADTSSGCLLTWYDQRLHLQILSETLPDDSNVTESDHQQVMFHKTLSVNGDGTQLPSTGN